MIYTSLIAWLLFSHSKHSLFYYFYILFGLYIILRIYSLHLFYYIFYNNWRFLHHFPRSSLHSSHFYDSFIFPMLILSIVNLIIYKKIWCFVHKYYIFRKSKQITFVGFFAVVFYFFKLVSTQKKINVSANFSKIKGLSNTDALGAKIRKITIFLSIWITYLIRKTLIYSCVVTIVSDLSYFSYISITFNYISNKWSSICVPLAIICHIYYLSEICSEISLLLHANLKNINSSSPIRSTI